MKIQEAWILHVVILALNVLNAVQQTTSSGRRRIVKGAVEVNQPRYFRNVSTLKQM